MTSPVSSIPNLGPASEAAFLRAGISSAEEIRALTRRVSELNDNVSKINQRQRTAQPTKPAQRAKRKVAAAPRRARAKRSKTAG